jgi:hypothetical protein
LVLVASGAKIPTKEHKSQKLAEAVAVPEVKGTTLFSGSTETLTSICEDAITAKDEFLIFVSKPLEITVLGRNKIYYEVALPVDSFKTVEEDYMATRAIEGLRTFFANIPVDIAFVGKEGYNIILEAQPRIAYVKTELFQDAEGLKEALDFYEEYRRAPAPPKPTEIKPLVEAPPTAIREPTEEEVLGLFTAGVMWSEESFFNEAKRRGWSLPKASEILAKLEREGVIYEPRPSFYARTEVGPPPPALPTVRAYWGTSPRGLPALWVEVYVEGKLKVRGHLEVRRETREILERIINEKIKDSIVDAGLPEDILLVDPLLKVTTDLVKTLLETAPPEVLAPPAVKSYAELEAEFKGKDAVDALASYVTNYYGLRRDYLLEDLNTYLRNLKTRLTDEDLQRFYRVYPGLKESFVAIASLISWIPPPPKDLEKIAEDALRELEGL